MSESFPNTESLVAQMIVPSEPLPSAPRFRRIFRLEPGHGGVTRATVRSTAFGIYEAMLDGDLISEDVLAPGWSSYEWRLRYQTYDVTHGLSQSSPEQSHTLAAVVGNGWYLGQLGWQGKRQLYGDARGLLLQLDIEYADGHTQTVATDQAWEFQGSEFLADDLYDGQTIDARYRDQTWSVGGDSGKWGSVQVTDVGPELVSTDAPPVRRYESLPALKIWTSPAGKILVDFGQNLVGWIRLKARGAAGQTVTVRHAEVLEDDELGVRPLRNADATDRFVLSGGDDEFEPTFTFHGFRYVEIAGYPRDLLEGDVEAVVVHSAMARTGSFECSNEVLNQFNRNVEWGLRGNFLEVPTDCPQRDERLGWTGDIAVFAPTATYLYDTKAFLSEWLRDVKVEQDNASGMVPFVVPDVLKYQTLPKELPVQQSAAIWSDAAVWVPAALWDAYGDKDLLAEQYPAMANHVRHVRSLLSDTMLWDQGFQFGDWLDPDSPPHKPADAKADPGVVATASLVRTASLAARLASVLDYHIDAQEFTDLAHHVRSAFQEHYVDHSGRIVSDCTTVYTLAIVFDVLAADQRSAAGDRLAQLVRQSNYRVTTGFAGTPYITEALSQTGHIEDAYQLLLETQLPSWLYPVTMGATTVWERWDSMLPDGTINPGEMTSFNHYALGSVADWMHRTLGGIAPAEPGYRRVKFAPRPPQGAMRDAVTWVRASLDTPYGTIRSHWYRSEEKVLLRVEIPSGVEGELHLPNEAVRVIREGKHEITIYD